MVESSVLNISLVDHEKRLREIEIREAADREAFLASETATKGDIKRVEDKIDQIIKWGGTAIVIFATSALPILLSRVF